MPLSCTGPVTGLGRTPPPHRKDMGPKAGKGPGTRDWGTPPPGGVQTENLTFPRTLHAGGKDTKYFSLVARWGNGHCLE